MIRPSDRAIAQAYLETLPSGYDETHPNNFPIMVRAHQIDDAAIGDFGGFDRITESKRCQLEDSGYMVCGYVMRRDSSHQAWLSSADPNDRAVLDGPRVTWHKHPLDATAAPVVVGEVTDAMVERALDAMFGTTPEETPRYAAGIRKALEAALAGD